MATSALTVLALNVSAPTPVRARALLERLWPDEDDVWVLTETSSGEGTRLITQVCRAAGHDVLISDPQQGGGRGVLVVGRGVALERERLEPPGLLPGRVLPVRVTADGVSLRLAAVYGAASDPVRYSSSAQRARKRVWLVELEAWVGRWLAAASSEPALLTGDLNLVDPAHDDPLPHVLPEETALLAALQDRHGLVDLWRAAHPGSIEVSWRDHSGVGCRYDHALGTGDVAGKVQDCSLVQDVLEEGLSDHAALRTTLAPPPV